MWINILGQITNPRINWDTNCSWVTRSRWERNKGHCHFPFSHSWSNVPYINLLKATRSLPTTVPPCVSLNPRCSHSLLIVPRHISLCRLVWWMRFPLQLISQFFFFFYLVIALFLEFLSLLSLFAFWNADIDIEVLVEKYHWHVICLPFQTDPNLSVPNYSKASTV